MTVGQALERAEELRPGSRIPRDTRLAWLQEADGLLRSRLFAPVETEAYEEVGADRAGKPLQDEVVLLALGETDRYAGEQAQYNSLCAELAAWLRRSYPPRRRTVWRW